MNYLVFINYDLLKSRINLYLKYIHPIVLNLEKTSVYRKLLCLSIILVMSHRFNIAETFLNRLTTNLFISIDKKHKKNMNCDTLFLKIKKEMKIYMQLKNYLVL